VLRGELLYDELGIKEEVKEGEELTREKEIPENPT